MTRALGQMMTEWPLKRLARQLVWDYTGIYCDEAVRQQTETGGHVKRIERLRDVIVRERAFRLPEEQMPAILLAIPGSIDVSYRSGEGVYCADYRLEVHSAVWATNAEVGGEISSILALAAAKVLLDGLPGGLDGRIADVTWQGKGAKELDDDEPSRSRHSDVHVLSVSMTDVLADGRGLPELPDPPLGGPAADPGDLPPVEETGTTTTPVEEIDP